MPSAKYRFFCSLLKHIEDIKETEKTKISMVYHTGNNTHCILRICKGRDLSKLCEVLCETRHPNIAVVYDYVYEDGDTYILEEHINGKSIKNIMDEDGIISENQTAQIISSVCSALEVLHKKTPPIVHNDINPSNIMICDDGTVKLFDFDISRLYQKGKGKNTELFGTEEYASPEHFGYGQSEPRTDIYCLGVTMHKMLTGNGLTSEHRMTYNGKLKNIINKCLEVDPNRRYTSVSDLNKKLLQFLSKKKRTVRIVRNILCIIAIVFSCFWVFKMCDFEELSHHIYNGKDFSVATSESTGSNIINSSSAIENENLQNITTPYANLGVSDQEPIKNNTRDTACSIALKPKIMGSCNSVEAIWYKFSTSSNISVYRISILPVDASTNTIFPYLTVAVYDPVGIKLEEFDIWSNDEYGFLDLELKPNTEYFVKINLGGRFDYGAYEMIVSEMVCDAGLDKENATNLVLGEQSVAKLDSTLSDWYVFQVPQDGEYTYTIHNIDVGCEIYFSKQQPRSAGEGMYVANEDNYSGTIRSVQKDEQVYFEIYPHGKNPKANGQYIIVVEKTEG